MREIRVLSILFVVFVVPSFGQRVMDHHAAREIRGEVVSFSGNILDIKPSDSHAVWVAIPEGMKVDRSELRPGAQVEVEARWDVTSYMATKAPEVAAAHH